MASIGSLVYVQRCKNICKNITIKLILFLTFIIQIDVSLSLTEVLVVIQYKKWYRKV